MLAKNHLLDQWLDPQIDSYRPDGYWDLKHDTPAALFPGGGLLAP